jgi:two-component system, NtrC family, response regulator AtoC
MTGNDATAEPQILIVDDDKYTRTLLEGVFRKKPVETQFACDVAEARSLFAATDFNLIIMDQRLPDGNGLDLVREMRAERPQQVAILITGYADVHDAVRAVREGLFDYLTKPFDNIEELEAVVEKALELDGAYREITRLRKSLEAGGSMAVLIGHSSAMVALQKQITQVAPLDVTVLIEGESGTGKELAARSIYAQSSRAKGRFLEVNCGALSEQLLESTLFGYEKGAFTGAAKTTPGYLEEVDGGTLFLDEIADMSPKLQSSLLRVLQESTFTRLGSAKVCSSDFRLVCATNKRLADEVKAGNFREDLFYRINVVALNILPLRERAEDIVPLAVHFLEQFNTKFGKEVGPLTPKALYLLERYPWPGNVRQLQNTIERAVALHSGGPVSTADLNDISEDLIDEETENGAVISYQKEREIFERDYLTRLLEQADGNVSEAARLSGIPRQNLYVRMKRWGLSQE